MSLLDIIVFFGCGFVVGMSSAYILTEMEFRGRVNRLLDEIESGRRIDPSQPKP